MSERKIKTTNGFRLDWYHNFFFLDYFCFLGHFFIFISFVDQFSTEWLNDLINATLYTLNPTIWTTQTNFSNIYFLINSFWFEISFTFSHFARIDSAIKKKKKKKKNKEKEEALHLTICFFRLSQWYSYLFHQIIWVWCLPCTHLFRVGPVQNIRSCANLNQCHSMQLILLHTKFTPNDIFIIKIFK